MRRALLALLLLAPLLPAPSAGAASGVSFTASIDPPLFEWTGTEVSRAPFSIRVTNTGTAPDAYVLLIRPGSGQPGAYQADYTQYYAPSPTLPLLPGESGVFHIWQQGLEQPPPVGPAAGDYAVRVTVGSTTDPSVTRQVEATIRRSFGTGSPAQVSGRVVDAATGRGVGDATVLLREPADSVMPRPEEWRQRTDPGGGFRFRASPGNHWLVVDAPGYASAFRQLVVQPGRDVQTEVRLEAARLPQARATSPTRTVDLDLPVYRAVFSEGLSLAATMPGFYTRQPGDPPEAMRLTSAQGEGLVEAPIPQEASVPFDYPPWTSTDGDVDVAPDGSFVAMATKGGTIEAYDADGEERWRVSLPDLVSPLVPGPLGKGLLRTSAVQVSPDGAWVAAGSLSGFVLLLDAGDGAPLWTFPTKGQIQALAFSPDGARLYAGSGDDHLYALDAEAGREIWRADLTFWPLHHIEVSRDGQRLATGGKDGALRVFDGDGRELWSRTTRQFVLGWAFSPDRARLYASGDGGLYAFEADTGKVLWWRPENPEAGPVAVSDDGALVAYGKPSSGLGDAVVRVVTSDGTPVWSFTGAAQDETVHQVGLLGDGSRLMAVGREGKLRVFEDWLQEAPPTPSTPPATASPPTTVAPTQGTTASPPSPSGPPSGTTTPTLPAAPDAAADTPGWAPALVMLALAGVATMRRRAPR